jgi:DNA-binding YbaB/EbfC family protein
MRGNIGNILKQAQAVQENLKKAQEQVAQITATGEAGGGMVMVTLNGKHEGVRVEIDPSLSGEDREML